MTGRIDDADYKRIKDGAYFLVDCSKGSSNPN